MLEEALTSALSGVANGRRYWVRAPQGAARPFVVLYRIDGVPSYQFCGRSLTASRIQANCIADTYTAAKQLARDVVAALDLYRDHSNGILVIFTDSEGRDLPEEDEGTVTYLYGVALDFIVHHS